MRAAGALALLASLVASAGCLNSFEEPAVPHSLHIVKLDLSPARVLSQDVLLNVTTILDNRGGGDSRTTRLQVKAYSEDTGFLIGENETTIGIVPGDKTKAVSMNVMVPRSGNVRVEVAVFEADQGEERASVTARNLGVLQPEILDTGLRIRETDFLVQNVTGGGGNGTRVGVQADLSITNEGTAPSESLRVEVKAREVTTRLVADVAWLDTGAIDPGATVVRSTNLTVPDGYNYAFEILTWRGDTVVARDEGDVQLAPTFVKRTDQDVVTTNPNVNDFLQTTMPTATTSAYAPGYSTPTYATPTPKVPGFEVAALAAAGVVAGIVLRRRGP